MKKVSIVIPCYNETDNVGLMSDCIRGMFDGELKAYDREIIFIDNASTDGTREKIRTICKEHSDVKAIFNNRNYGAFSSPFHAMLQADGDCVIILACDFQEPPELIPEFIRKWEEGAEVVCGVQSGSRENKIVRAFRNMYYRLMRMGTDLDYIDHFTGFGLFDRSFVEILREADDPLPFLRGMVVEFGSRIEKVYYEQPKRMHGKTHHGFLQLYDAAMISFTSYTSMGLRLVTLFGFIVGLFSFVTGVIYLIYKLVNWYKFDAGMAPVLIGLFFLGAVILISIGLMGEYLININRRLMHRPLVTEAERINFERRS